MGLAELILGFSVVTVIQLVPVSHFSLVNCKTAMYGTFEIHKQIQIKKKSKNKFRVKKISAFYFDVKVWVCLRLTTAGYY